MNRAAESGHSPDPMNLTQFALPEGSHGHTAVLAHVVFLRPASQPCEATLCPPHFFHKTPLYAV